MKEWNMLRERREPFAPTWHVNITFDGIKDAGLKDMLGFKWKLSSTSFRLPFAPMFKIKSAKELQKTEEGSRILEKL